MGDSIGLANLIKVTKAVDYKDGYVSLTSLNLSVAQYVLRGEGCVQI